MKKYLLTAIIITLLSGCASMRKDRDKEMIGKVDTKPQKETEQSLEKKISQLEKLNDWFSYPVAQNKVQKTGSPIIQPYSRGGIYFEIYYDEKELKNYDYYDHKLHVDYAWKIDETDGTWVKMENSKSIHEGLLYINPAYKVAMYYYRGENGAFDVFKVNIKYTIQ